LERESRLLNSIESEIIATSEKIEEYSDKIKSQNLKLASKEAQLKGTSFFGKDRKILKSEIKQINEEIDSLTALKNEVDSSDFRKRQQEYQNLLEKLGNNRIV